ncbi:MAG: hypothetical protein LBL32_00020 [Holosporales bacterium]|jgi:hypothetical protein|nr:hypothetical protein [Holosporales bacterium]
MIKIKHPLISIAFLAFGIGSAAADDPPEFNPNEIETVIWLEHKLDGSGGGAIIGPTDLAFTQTGRYILEELDYSYQFNGEEVPGKSLLHKIGERSIWETNEPAMLICNDGESRYVWLCSWPSNIAILSPTEYYSPANAVEQWDWLLYGPSYNWTDDSGVQVPVHSTPWAVVDITAKNTYHISEKCQILQKTPAHSGNMPNDFWFNKVAQWLVNGTNEASPKASLYEFFLGRLKEDNQTICKLNIPYYHYQPSAPAIPEGDDITPPPNPNPSPCPVHKPGLKDLLRLGIPAGVLGFGIGLSLHDAL